ncbi:MAG: hypothetical protein KDA87_12530 [Planctomycetales bacterium]|nr:hypothetical protein [Planctomycetales bacterium]
MDRPQFAESNSLAQTLGQQLIDGLLSWKVDFGLERSVRISPAGIYPNRFLISLDLNAVSQPAAQLTATLDKLDCPADASAQCQHYLKNASHVHWGFEDQADAPLYKVYLEFADPLRPAPHSLQSMSDGGALQFVSWKWQVHQQISHQTLYSRMDHWTWETLQDHIAADLSQADHQDFSHEILSVLRLLANRISHRFVRTLQVTERTSQRHSWDANLYDFQISCEPILPAIQSLATIYRWDEVSVSELCQKIRHDQLGHIAVGIHRNQLPFLTVYHGVELHRA